MERRYLAAIIVVLCALSLFAGVFVPKTRQVQKPVVKANSVFEQVDTTGDRIALLNIEGAISADALSSAWSEGFSLDSFLASLDRVRKDKKAKAVVIRINSPGGTVAASQDIYDAIMILRKEKPVVVSMADVTASGGYYIASAADRIVAQRGTMTGSIGVIFNFTDVAKLADKIGVTSNVIKSGKYKDSGSMYRKMTDDEKNLFQSSIDEAYKQFVGDITKARVERKDNYEVQKRELSAETLKKYADGRIFLGSEAYELGFVDIIGSQDYARIIASDMAGYKTPLPFVSYNKLSGWRSILMNIEGMFKAPVQGVLPFSFSHNSRPLMIWE